MKVVIGIPDGCYEELNNGQFPVQDAYRLVAWIKDGTPLPKCHGRLIDADELKTLCYEVLLDTDNPNTSDGLSSANGIVEEDIDLAPTIIEADRAESEKDSTTTNIGSTTDSTTIGPCGDCIRREDAIQAVTHFKDTLKRLYELPAVNPIKVGHWIEHNNPNLGRCMMVSYECSCCHAWLGCEYFIRKSYCPNCGAKMEVEV